MNHKFKKDDIEIMAPVGSFESLAAAVQAGADSVYFGVEQLNMRAKSSINFTLDDLNEIVSICRQNNIKSYLTLNTILYDHDLNVMRRIIDAAYDSKITAIIASDIAVLNYASTKGMEIHASTQLNVSNIESLKFYAHFCDVIVLARELSLKQVKEITTQIQEQNICGPRGELVKIEIFAHGALCMAVSGKCYLSLHEKNSSANRGACQQTCRKAYTVTEKESGYQLEIDNEYIMSPKDLCTISFIDKILDAGVSVLKIEGRARPAEYVKIVAGTYREAVDAWVDGRFTPENIARWEERLGSVFNRGFWDGYYLGRKLGEWSSNYGSSASKRKIYLGKCMNYFSNIGVGEFQLEAAGLDLHDEILIVGPTTGVVETTVQEIRIDLKPVPEAKKGNRISFKVPEKVRRSDKLYKWVKATASLMQ